MPSAAGSWPNRATGPLAGDLGAVVSPHAGATTRREEEVAPRRRSKSLAKEITGVKAAGMAATYETCVVFILGYPGMGKRTTGAHLAELLDGVLVDNQLLYLPIVELFRWDGKAPLPPEIWDRVIPIRNAVLGAIEDLAPASNSYVFTNVLPAHDPTAEEHYNSIRSLAQRRGSLFLAVVMTCDIDVQVSRIDNPDRIALRKGSDPEGYRQHRLTVKLFEPPTADIFHIDSTDTPATDNAALILQELRARGFTPRTPSGVGNAQPAQDPSPRRDLP